MMLSVVPTMEFNDFADGLCMCVFSVMLKKTSLLYIMPQNVYPNLLSKLHCSIYDTFFTLTCGHLTMSSSCIKFPSIFLSLRGINYFHFYLIIVNINYSLSLLSIKHIIPNIAALCMHMVFRFFKDRIFISTLECIIDAFDVSILMCDRQNEEISQVEFV